MKSSLSPPVRFLLAATIVGTAVVMLLPEPVEQTLVAPVGNQPPHAPKLGVPKTMHADAQPWKRHKLPEPVQTQTAASASLVAPPLPTQAGLNSDAGHTPPLPSAPPEQVQSDIVYLGRIIKDDKVQVFLASHGEPFVVGQGDLLNGTWLVQAVSSANVTLRHVGSGKTSVISMGDSTVSHATDAKTVQVGPRFLANGPAPSQANN